MDLESGMLNEVSQIEKEISYDISYTWNLKRDNKNELTKQRLTDLENELMVVGGEGIVRESGMDVYTLLYLKWIINKVLLYSTLNSAQCHMAAWMGRGFRGERIHVYVRLSHFAIHLKLLQQMLIGYSPIQNLKIIIIPQVPSNHYSAFHLCEFAYSRNFTQVE